MKGKGGGEGLHLTESLDDIARRCFEEEENQLPVTRAVGTFVQVMVVACVLAYFLNLTSGSPVLLATVVTVGTSIFAASRLLPRRLAARTLASFRAGDPKAVRRVYQFAVREFHQQVETHRTRTLGSDSEWGTARASLAEAADEAQRSESPTGRPAYSRSRTTSWPPVNRGRPRSWTKSSGPL